MGMPWSGSPVSRWQVVFHRNHVFDGVLLQLGWLLGIMGPLCCPPTCLLIHPTSTLNPPSCRRGRGAWS